MAKKCLESAPGKGFWVTLMCHSREACPRENGERESSD